MSVSETPKFQTPFEPPKENLAVNCITSPRWRRYLLLVWLLIGAILALGSAAFAWPMNDPRPFLGLCLPLAAAVIVVPFVFTFCWRWLIEWSGGTPAFAKPPTGGPAANIGSDIWLKQQLSFFHAWYPMSITGALVSLVALPVYWRAGYPVGYDRPASIFAAALLAFSAFLAGMGGRALYCATLMIWRFGDYRIAVRDHKFGVLSTGRVLVQCYFTIAVVWAVYTLSAVLPRLDLRMAAIPLTVLSGPAFFGILACFVIGQFPLHKRMVEFKRIELSKVEDKLDTGLRTLDDLTKEVRDEISFLQDQRERILALPEWPFAFTTLLGAIGSAVTPALLSSAVTAALKSLFPTH